MDYDDVPAGATPPSSHIPSCCAPLHTPSSASALFSHKPFQSPDRCTTLPFIILFFTPLLGLIDRHSLLLAASWASVLCHSDAHAHAHAQAHGLVLVHDLCCLILFLLSPKTPDQPSLEGIQGGPLPRPPFRLFLPLRADPLPIPPHLPCQSDSLQPQVRMRRSPTLSD